jgi:hypothetical protein
VFAPANCTVSSEGRSASQTVLTRLRGTRHHPTSQPTFELAAGVTRHHPTDFDTLLSPSPFFPQDKRLMTCERSLFDHGLKLCESCRLNVQNDVSEAAAGMFCSSAPASAV